MSLLRDYFHTQEALSLHEEICAFLMILIITTSAATLCTDQVSSTSANGSPAPTGYHSAQYEIPGGIQFFSHPVNESVEGNLFYFRTLPNDQGVEFVNVTLILANLTLTLKFNCTNGKLFFNSTYYGTNIFEVTGLKSGESVDLGSGTQRQVGVAKGPYQMGTPYGSQSYWLVEVEAQLSKITILSGYFYHVRTGLLLGGYTPAAWLFNLFGIEVIYGNIQLTSTNIDLGPQDILTYIGDFFPILFLLMIVIAIAVIYRRKHKHRRRERHSRLR